jgi:hypothetical protein
VTDTKELRRLALLATPGPWEADAPSELHPYKWAVRCPSTPPAISHQLCLLSCINHNEQQDAEYIAAASPSVVLALLDEVEALRKDAGRYRHIRDGEHNGYLLNGPRGIGNFQVSQKVRDGEGRFHHGLYLDAAIDAAMAGLASPQPEKEEG